jgi:hypothetical protein
MSAELQTRELIMQNWLVKATAMSVAPLDIQLLSVTATEMADTDLVQNTKLQPQQIAIRIVGFFSLVIFLAITLNILITSGLRRITTSTYGTWNQVMQGEVNADVIISGSSRAANHYDPRAIEAATGYTAFNLGQNGSQTDVQLAVLKTYLEHNRKPRLVIHNLDAFSFVTTREVFDPGQYIPYLQDPEIYHALKQIDPEFIKGRYVPLYGYVVQDMNFAWVLGLKRLLGWSPSEDHIDGFTPRARQWTNDFQKFKINNPNGMNFSIEPKGVRAVEQLIRLCQDSGIELILVYSPEYAEMQSMETNRSEIFAEFHVLSSQYHLPFWNYSSWKYSGDRDYFYNSQHLNANGAEVFSADVANRLREYATSQPSPMDVSMVPHQPKPVSGQR